ncbi:MAG: FHA domain-containing protein [Actinomycetes bacterium]
MTTTTLVLVDLSNVCRDESLGFSTEKASWPRWIRLEAAVRGHLGAETAFHLIADTNLREFLSRSDQARFDLGVRDKSIETSATADQLILDDAINRGAFVLSNDGFTDYMKMPGVLDLHILRWGVRMGSVLVTEVRLQAPHSVLITERVEQEEVKRKWANPRDLDRKWRCRNDTCIEGLVLIPKMREGSALCPSCESYLSDEGKWRDAAMVKILCGSSEIGRLTLEDGDRCTVGRLDDGVAGFDPSAHLAPAEADKISRRHLELRNEQGRILVEDLESTNGSEVLTPTESRLRRKGWRPGVRMRPGTVVTLRRGTRVRLGGTRVVVELSGRRFGR